jgi:hypothetical protein
VNQTGIEKFGFFDFASSVLYIIVMVAQILNYVFVFFPFVVLILS